MIFIYLVKENGNGVCKFKYLSLYLQGIPKETIDVEARNYKRLNMLINIIEFYSVHPMKQKLAF